MYKLVKAFTELSTCITTVTLDKEETGKNVNTGST